MPNRKRPDIEPCGTPNMISQYVMHALFILVLCNSYKELRSIKEFSNHEFV